MTARRTEPTVSRGPKAKCFRCSQVFYKQYEDSDEKCHGCRADTAPETRARRRSEKDCASCGHAVVLSEGVLTHLEAERDEYHVAL